MTPEQKYFNKEHSRLYKLWQKENDPEQADIIMSRIDRLKTLYHGINYSQPFLSTPLTELPKYTGIYAQVYKEQNKKYQEKLIKPRVRNGWLITKSEIPGHYNLTWLNNKHLPTIYQRPKVKIVGWANVIEFTN